MEIILVPLKAIVFFDPHDYVQHCEDNGTNPSLDGFHEYVSNEMKRKGCNTPYIEKDWSEHYSSYLIKDEDDDEDYDAEFDAASYT